MPKQGTVGRGRGGRGSKDGGLSKEYIIRSLLSPIVILESSNMLTIIHMSMCKYQMEKLRFSDLLRAIEISEFVEGNSKCNLERGI